MTRDSIVSRKRPAEEHHQMLDHMHEALTQLREPLLQAGTMDHHLLPDGLKSEHSAKVEAAKEHIMKLYHAFKSATKPGVRPGAMTDRKQPNDLPVQTGGPGTSGLQEMNK